MSANPQVRVRVLDELQQLRSHLHGHQPLDAACRAERHHFFRPVGVRGVGWDPYFLLKVLLRDSVTILA